MGRVHASLSRSLGTIRAHVLNSNEEFYNVWACGVVVPHPLRMREVPGSIPCVSNCFQGLLGVRCVVTFRFNASVSPTLRLAVTGGVACDLEGCAAEVCQVVLVRLVLSRNIVQMRCFCVPGHFGIV